MGVVVSPSTYLVDWEGGLFFKKMTEDLEAEQQLRLALSANPQRAKDWNNLACLVAVW